MQACSKICNAIFSLLFILSISCSISASTNLAGNALLSLPHTLPADQALSLSLHYDNASLKLEWQIAPGCYLYQNQLQATLLTASNKKVSLLTTQPLPAPKIIDDPYFGQQAIYQGGLTVSLPLTLLLPYSLSNQPLWLQIDYQGCADSGFCYPPLTKWVKIKIAKDKIIDILTLNEAPVFAPQNNSSSIPNLEQVQKEHRVFGAIITFYVLGILLAFTPCVFPMIPILMSIIVGQKYLNTRKAFFLSLSYVLSMAFTYALAGIIVATLGKNLQAQLQQPIVIIGFSSLFALLALIQMEVIHFSVFQFFRLNDLFTRLQTKQTSGTYIGAAIMGILATLISSPCVTAPLIGALSYISQSGNIVLGGSALLAMGLGMGTILLIVGTLGGKYIPKSGPWLQTVNQLFAIMMFGLSVWLLDRLFHGPFVLTLWGVLCLFMAYCMNTFRLKANLSARLGVIFVLYAGILFWGAWRGESDPLKPLRFNPWLINQSQDRSSLNFQTIHTLAELKSVQVNMKNQDKPILLVFYADWCISCQHLERTLFSDPLAKEKLMHWKLVRADVTHYTQASEQLLKQFDLIGPPTLLFFDNNGKEITQYRIVGEVSVQKFLTQLDEVYHP